MFASAGQEERVPVRAEGTMMAEEERCRERERERERGGGRGSLSEGS